MTAHHPDIVKALSDGLRPRQRLSLSEWSDRYRYLSVASERGQWKTAKTPYLREPMDCLSAHDSTETVVMIKSSQLGFSEMLNNWVLYVIHHAPGPMLMVQPDIASAERYSKQRIAKAIADTPVVRELVVEAKSRDSGNTITDKEFPNGTFTIVGSNVESALSSMPIRYVAIDEWDRFKISPFGDQAATAIERTNTYPRRKVALGSTPGEKATSKVEPAYEESSQGEYFLPCPHCGHEQVLSFKRLVWPAATPRLATYQCVACQRMIEDRHKRDAYRRDVCRWIHRYPERPVRGFKLWAGYSPWLTFGEIAERFVKAKGRPQRMRVFVNTVLGESWDTHQETRVEPSKLTRLRFRLETIDGVPVVPAGVAVLTCGVDVQADRFELTLKGWGRGEEQWTLEHRRIPCDPTTPTAWAELAEYLGASWPTVAGDMMGLSAVAIDSGFLTSKVEEFVRMHGARRWWATKGAAGQGRKPWPKKPSKSAKRGVDIYVIGVDTLKTNLYARLKGSVELAEKGVASGVGFVHLADVLVDDPDYLAGLVSEVPEVRYVKGHPRIDWILPEHKRNEPLDCSVYADAALAGWKARGRRLPAPVAAPSSPPTEKRISGRPANHISRPEIQNLPQPSPRATVDAPRERGTIDPRRRPHADPYEPR